MDILHILIHIKIFPRISIMFHMFFKSALPEQQKKSFSENYLHTQELKIFLNDISGIRTSKINNFVSESIFDNQFWTSERKIAGIPFPGKIPRNPRLRFPGKSHDL